MKKSLIAGASVMALAGALMPVAGVFAVTDTIKVTVNDSCSFNSTTPGSGAEYAASGANGADVNPSNSSSNVHSFTVFCNKKSGYTVTATATKLSGAISGNTDSFAYKATLDSDASWNAAITGSTGATASQLTPGQDGGATGTIITGTGPTASAGQSFTAAYTAHIGATTAADVYTGTIEYTVVPGA